MDATAKLRYIKPNALYETEKPYYIFSEVPRGFKRGNLDYEEGPEQLITDIRGREADFSLDEHGFAYQTWVAPSINWRDEDEISSNYIPNVKELLSTLLDGRIERYELCGWRVGYLLPLVSTLSLHRRLWI
jgi:hypothetical protein